MPRDLGGVLTKMSIISRGQNKKSFGFYLTSLGNDLGSVKRRLVGLACALAVYGGWVGGEVGGTEGGQEATETVQVEVEPELRQGAGRRSRDHPPEKQ